MVLLLHRLLVRRFMTAAACVKEKFISTCRNDDSYRDGDKLDYVKLLKDQNLPFVEVTHTSGRSEEANKYSAHAYCAHFVEVHVHAATGDG